MTGKEKVMTGLRIGVVMVIGSLLVGTACKKSIEYYRKRKAQSEQELIFEEESL